MFWTLVRTIIWNQRWRWPRQRRVPSSRYSSSQHPRVWGSDMNVKEDLLEVFLESTAVLIIKPFQQFKLLVTLARLLLSYLVSPTMLLTNLILTILLARRDARKESALSTWTTTWPPPSQTWGFSVSRRKISTSRSHFANKSEWIRFKVGRKYHSAMKYCNSRKISEFLPIFSWVCTQD